MSVLGIDVSHDQGEIDWFSVARSATRFAFAKATDGSTFVDPFFAKNWPRIRDVGLLRGAYHYARPGGDPEAQASHFAGVAGPLAWGQLPPAIDLEVTDGLSKDALIDWTLAFTAKAEALFGCPLIVYTGGLWRNQLGNPVVSGLSTRLLWTARYGSLEPVVPATWTKWTFWQFTDGTYGDARAIPGISGPVDCDWFAGSEDDLQQLSAGLTTGTPMAPVPATPAGDVWPGRIFAWPFSPTITGPDVARWQTRVSQRGFPVAVDGIYGPQSKRACIAFQRHAGLTPDGIVGRHTWNATFGVD